jgi:hypothetical protein
MAKTYDLTDQLITLTPQNLSDGIKTAVVNAQTRIEELRTGHDSLTTEVESTLNALDVRLTALDGATDLDIADVMDKINTLNDIMSKDGSANDLFDALAILGNAWNDAGELIVSQEVDFNSATGEAAVDLTAFGFANSGEYKVSVSTDSKGAGVARVGVDKTSASEAKVIAFDAKHFVEDAVKYDASAAGNNFNATVSVIYTRPTLSFTLTDEEGNATSV